MEIGIVLGIVIFWLWWRINILKGRVDVMEKIIVKLSTPSPAQNLSNLLQEEIYRRKQETL